jgi:hypothetical protein
LTLFSQLSINTPAKDPLPRVSLILVIKELGRSAISPQFIFANHSGNSRQVWQNITEGMSIYLTFIKKYLVLYKNFFVIASCITLI